MFNIVVMNAVLANNGRLAIEDPFRIIIFILMGILVFVSFFIIGFISRSIYLDVKNNPSGRDRDA